MNSTPYNSIFDTLQRWLSMRSHRERISILIIGLIVIYFFWYVGLQKPLRLERQHIHQQSQALKAQIEIFKKESEKVTKEAEARAVKQRQSQEARGALNTKVEWASSSDIDEIIKAILNIKHNVQFVSLRTTTASEATVLSAPPTGNTLELVFNSSYFDTIAYLEQLEKIPWCLSWDNIEYKVTTYPQATVTVHLSIVSN
jgi:hypothetical protein